LRAERAETDIERENVR